MSIFYLLRSFASKNKRTVYSPEEAIKLLRSEMKKPEKEAFELIVKLGVDSTRGEQMVRGNVFMPSGTGKYKKLGVFIPEEHKELAIKLGAKYAGDDLLNKVKEGKIEFEQVLATEEMIDALKPYARTLGQLGLMPTVRNNTLIPFTSLEEEMNKLKKGVVSYRMTKNSIIQGPLGKARYSDDQILVNLRAFMTDIYESKPRDFKKTYYKKVFLKTSFGKAYELDLQLVDLGHYRCVLQNYKYDKSTGMI